MNLAAALPHGHKCRPLYSDPPIAYDIDERPAQRGAHGRRADWAECQTTFVTANDQLAFSPQRTLLVGTMASLRLAWGASKPTTPLRVSQTSVRWMAAGGDPRVAKDAATMADPRVDIIRRTLYPANVRSRESPTGTWRSNVGRRLQRAIPSVQAHETIERAWLLHQRHIRRGRQAELERKFKCMKEAMDYLYELDPKLHAEANKVEDPRVRTPQEVQLLKTLKGQEKKAIESRIRGLFPRELRIPTDTPSRDGWRYDWDPPIAPL